MSVAWPMEHSRSEVDSSLNHKTCEFMGTFQCLPLDVGNP